MKRFTLYFIFLLLIAHSSLTIAQVPRYITHQGFLTNSAGVAYDTTLSMTFRIFSTLTEGTPIYEQNINFAQVRKGIFNATLGPITSPFDAQYYLEIVVAGETFTPRTQLTSVPYSLRADTAEYAKAVLGGGSVSLPFPGTVNTNSEPINVVQNGIGGGINVQIDNVNNGSRALNVATTGGNDAIYSQTLGTASAGNFVVNNAGNFFGAAVMATSNGSYTMYSQNNGNGSAGEFKINTPSSTSTALNTENAGTGYIARFAGGNNLSKGVLIDINSAIDRAHLTLYEFENDYARLSFQNGSAEGYWTIAGLTNTTAGNSRLNFYSSQLGADAMSITGTGNVGIGNGNPEYKLHVEGTVNAAEFRQNGSLLNSSQWTGSNNNIGYATGNVGVGTTTPSSKFEVVDNANAANMKITGSGTWGSQLELNPTETGSKRWMLSSVGTAGATRQGNLEFTNSTDGTTALALSPTGDVTMTGALKPNGNTGTTGQVLQSNGANNVPTWVSPSSVQYNNIIQVSQSEQIVAWGGGVVYPIPGMLYTLNIASHSKVLVQINAVVTQYPNEVQSIRGDFTQTVAPAANLNSPVFSKIFGVNGTYFEPTFLQFLIELDAGSYVFNTKFTRSTIVNGTAIVVDCNMVIQVIPQ